MKYGERLRAARTYAGLTQPTLASKVGMSQPNISNLENGDATGSEFTVQLASACGVRPEWLAMEQGEMYGPKPLVAAEPPATYQAKDPLLDDLAVLDKFEAEAYTARLDSLRAQIRSIEADVRSAANKARQEKSDQRPISGAGDPSSEGRRTA